MKRPSRGELLSAATMRYVGCFFLPILMRRSFTATNSILAVWADPPGRPFGCLGPTSGPAMSLSGPLAKRAEVCERRRDAAALALLPLPAGALAASDPLHHPLHLLELLEQGVHLGGGRAAPVGDAHPPRPVDNGGIAALSRGHGADDRLDPPQLPVVDGGVLHLLGQPGKHAEDTREGAHLLDL